MILELENDFDPNSIELYNKNYNLHLWSHLEVKGIVTFNFVLNLFKNIKFYFLYKDFYSITKAKLKLKKFRNLKKIFIGDEYNFPNYISIASKLLKIPVVAYQQRINIPANKNQILVDKYLILGDKSKIDMQYQVCKNIELIKVGNYEVTEFDVLKDEKEEKKFKFSCLVLDQATGSKKKWFENITNHQVNHYSHYHFIKNVLELGKNFPNILFTIKSKQFDWLDDDYYKELLANILTQKNIKFFQKKNHVSNLSMINNYDFAIGKHTSLLDFFLERNKPIIIYDDAHVVFKNINYGNDIIVDNYHDFQNKLNEIYNNYDLIQSKQKKIKNNFFYKFNKDSYLKLLKEDLLDIS